MSQNNYLKKNTWVRHPKADWGKGIVINDVFNNRAEIYFEKVGKKILDLDIVNLVVLPFDEINNEFAAKKIINMSRIYYMDKFKEIYEDVKSKYPEHLLIIQNGCYYEQLFDDAQLCNRSFGWEIYEALGGILKTGFNIDSQSCWDKIYNLGKPFVLIEQITTGVNAERKITKIHP